MENMVAFWKGKKVLITGHTGFKGSWLSLWLQLLGADVIGFSLTPPTPTNLFTVARVSEGLVDLRGDIRDYQALHAVIVAHQPEIIFHLAAQSLVRLSYQAPLENYSTNVMGTVHLLEAARHSNLVRAIINVTTDKCYENQEWHRSYSENDPLGGHDPYSSSKGCSELITAAYRNSFFNDSSIGLASVRAGNVIGGGDWSQDRLIPDLVAAFFQNKPLEIRYPDAIRPWQHVLDVLYGYLQLAELLYQYPKQYAEAWNFGPEEKNIKSVQWIVEKTSEILNKKIPFKFSQEKNPHEAAILKLDSMKARKKLDWRSRFDLEQALQATFSWYKAYFDKAKDPRSVCQAQINTYFETIQPVEITQDG